MSALLAASDFFTGESVLTFGGASGATVIVGNTARALFRRDVLWIPFAVAVALALAIAYSADALGDPVNWLLALLNACLLFCTALGIEEGAVAARKPREEGLPRPQAGTPVPWLSSWVRRDA